MYKRQEIREFDLLARKAFFTNRWQVKTGGLLLFFSVVVIIVCLQTIDLMKKKIPGMPAGEKESIWDVRTIKRKWVAGEGITLVLVALVLTFLSHNELEQTLATANSVDQVVSENQPGKVSIDPKGNEKADKLQENDRGSDHNRYIKQIVGRGNGWVSICLLYTSPSPRD